MNRMLLLLALLCGPVWSQTAVIYSRADAGPAYRMAAVAQLFGAVHIDVALAPGVPWRQAIAERICMSERVLLVWSERAAASVEVAREIQTAMLCGVPVVPVLLDATPLPSDVTLHGLEWRDGCE